MWRQMRTPAADVSGMRKRTGRRDGFRLTVNLKQIKAENAEADAVCFIRPEGAQPGNGAIVRSVSLHAASNTRGLGVMASNWRPLTRGSLLQTAGGGARAKRTRCLQSCGRRPITTGLFRSGTGSFFTSGHLEAFDWNLMGRRPF